MNKLIKAEVFNNTDLTDNHFLIELTPLSDIIPFTPGQFYMLEASSSPDQLLKRPFSVLDYKKKRLSFLIKVKGKGTALLKNLSKGKIINIIGPLGNGYPPANDNEKLLVAAGGIGIASVFSLLRKYDNTVLFYGIKTKNELLLYEKLKDMSSELYISSDDGSIGEKGNVLKILKKYLLDRDSDNSKYRLYCCGPNIMYKNLAQTSFNSVLEIFISLEEIMACGIGACLGCAVKSNDSYKMVCKDGPVFNIKEIRYES